MTTGAQDRFEAPADARVGHVHLRVPDLDRAVPGSWIHLFHEARAVLLGAGGHDRHIGPKIRAMAERQPDMVTENERPGIRHLQPSRLKQMVAERLERPHLEEKTA